MISSCNTGACGRAGRAFNGGVVVSGWLAALACLGAVVGLWACGGDQRLRPADAAPDIVKVADHDLGVVVVVEDKDGAVDAAPADSSADSSADSMRSDVEPPPPCEVEFEPGDCEAKQLCGPVHDSCTDKTHQCSGCTGRRVCNLLTNTCEQPLATCSQLYQAKGIECGVVRNSCGKWLECPRPGERCAVDQECDPDTHTCRPCQVPQNEAGCDLLGYECGQAWLGCGPKSNRVDCKGCPDGKTCNESYHKCEPETCSGKQPAEICAEAQAARGVECGLISDGCGGLVDCGKCEQAGHECGIAGIPNRCTEVPKPWECIAQDRECGTITSACGGKVHCGDCTDPAASCYDGKCCIPTLTCDSPEYAGKCGKGLDNGCAPELDCGCGDYDSCSTTTPGELGTCLACVPKTKAELCKYPACGEVDAGCGVKIDCGCKSRTETCYREKCCEPQQVTCFPWDCGPKSDGCGRGWKDCGECACTPRTKCSSYKECGEEKDRCTGEMIPCGTCTAPEKCHSGKCCQQLPTSTYCRKKCGTYRECGRTYTCYDGCPCTPKSQAVACAGECGTVNAGCGVTYSCSCDWCWDGCGSQTGRAVLDACGQLHDCGPG